MKTNIFSEFRTLSPDPAFQMAITMLEMDAVMESDRRAFTEKAIKAIYPKAPEGYRVARWNFWYKLIFEKAHHKGLFLPDRAEKAAEWIAAERKAAGENWPPKPTFQRFVGVPQPSMYR